MKYISITIVSIILCLQTALSQPVIDSAAYELLMERIGKLEQEVDQQQEYEQAEKKSHPLPLNSEVTF